MCRSVVVAMTVFLFTIALSASFALNPSEVRSHFVDVKSTLSSMTLSVKYTAQNENHNPTALAGYSGDGSVLRSGMQDFLAGGNGKYFHHTKAADGLYESRYSFDGTQYRHVIKYRSTGDGEETVTGSISTNRGMMPSSLPLMQIYHFPLTVPLEIMKISPVPDTPDQVLLSWNKDDRSTEILLDTEKVAALKVAMYFNGKPVAEEIYSDYVSFEGLYLPSKVSSKRYNNQDGSLVSAVEYSGISYEKISGAELDKLVEFEIPESAKAGPLYPVMQGQPRN